jgi:hypothetical protein
LNPLHPSITPLTEKESCHPQADAYRARKGQKPPGSSINNASRSATARSKGKSTEPHAVRPSPILSRPVSTTGDDRIPLKSTPGKVEEARDAKTGQVIPGLPMSAVGQASRFGDKALSGTSRCNVFEVVFQQKEKTACPACVRSPRRARLPARKGPHTTPYDKPLTSFPPSLDARGCFAPS